MKIKEILKMLFGKKPYPILPTSESDTLTFLQKLDLLEYKVAELTNKVYEIETALATKSSVSATASGGEIQTITVDGTTYNVPQGGGELTTTTVDLESGWGGNDAVLERGGRTCVLKIFAK
jgi:hypothetical protein